MEGAERVRSDTISQFLPVNLTLEDFDWQALIVHSYTLGLPEVTVQSTIRPCSPPVEPQSRALSAP